LKRAAPAASPRGRRRPARDAANEPRGRQRGRRDEVHAAERADEALQPGAVGRAVLVEQRHVAVARVAAVRGAVAAHVADLQRVVVQAPAAPASICDQTSSPPNVRYSSFHRAWLPTKAAGWNENIRKPMSRQSRMTCATSPRLRGVTVMLCAR
jgi:hypothetical protein